MLISQHSWYERKSRQFSFPLQENTSRSLNVIASVVLPPTLLSSHPVNVPTEEKCDEILNIIQYVISVGNFDKVAEMKKKISVASSSEKPMRKVQKDSFFSLAFSSPLRRNFLQWESSQSDDKVSSHFAEARKVFLPSSLLHAQLNDD